MARAGIRWIRGFPTFNVIEPVQGKFDWSSVDAMIGTAAKNKMTISGLFFYNAPWIHARGDSLPIDNLPAWREYVSNVVMHCKASVKHWEVWNETPTSSARVRRRITPGPSSPHSTRPRPPTQDATLASRSKV
jgi:GH35 family endo-1,4-beta-xylanase